MTFAPRYKLVTSDYRSKSESYSLQPSENHQGGRHLDDLVEDASNTSSTTSASSIPPLESRTKEEETLDWASFGSCLGAKLESNCLWDLAKRRIPAPTQPSTELGEPDVECTTLLLTLFTS